MLSSEDLLQAPGLRSTQLTVLLMDEIAQKEGLDRDGRVRAEEKGAGQMGDLDLSEQNMSIGPTSLSDILQRKIEPCAAVPALETQRKTLLKIS